MFPERRLRRLRKRNIQPLFQETVLRIDDMVAPLFFDESATVPVEIASMPGQYRYPLGMAGGIAQLVAKTGVRAVILFGIPARKDAGGTEAYNPEGIIQQAVRAIKAAVPDLVVITDVCACEYTDHGHCGIVGKTPCGPDLLNDPSLELMALIAVSHAEAGADIVAPSCMLDGMVMAIREELDCEGFEDTAIMSYSSKFASALYGPFRDAADSGFTFGDRTTYQIGRAHV